MSSQKEPLEKLADKQLVEQILNTKANKRKRRLQEELYGRYVPKIYYKCYNLIKEQEKAKDATHDIFIKIFTKLNKYKGAAHFYSWIMAITYNHCISFLEKEKRLQFEPLEENEKTISLQYIEEEHQQLLQLQTKQVQQLLPKLKEIERIILLMRYQEGLSIKQIAAILKIKESAAKMRLKRSRDQLTFLFEKLQNG